MKHKILTLTSILLIITFTSQQVVWGWPDYIYEVFDGLRPRAFGKGRTAVTAEEMGVTGDTLLTLHDGRKVPIVKIKPGDYVLSLNETTGGIEPHRVNGLKGWVKVSEFQVGETIAVLREEPAKPKANLNDVDVSRASGQWKTIQKILKQSRKALQVLSQTRYSPPLGQTKVPKTAKNTIDNNRKSLIQMLNLRKNSLASAAAIRIFSTSIIVLANSSRLVLENTGFGSIFMLSSLSHIFKAVKRALLFTHEEIAFAGDVLHNAILWDRLTLASILLIVTFTSQQLACAPIPPTQWYGALRPVAAGEKRRIFEFDGRSPAEIAQHPYPEILNLDARLPGEEPKKAIDGEILRFRNLLLICTFTQEALDEYTQKLVRLLTYPDSHIKHESATAFGELIKSRHPISDDIMDKRSQELVALLIEEDEETRRRAKDILMSLFKSARLIPQYVLDKRVHDLIALLTHKSHYTRHDTRYDYNVLVELLRSNRPISPDALASAARRLTVLLTYKKGDIYQRATNTECAAAALAVLFDNRHAISLIPQPIINTAARKLTGLLDNGDDDIKEAAAVALESLFNSDRSIPPDTISQAGAKLIGLVTHQNEKVADCAYGAIAVLARGNRALPTGLANEISRLEVASMKEVQMQATGEQGIDRFVQLVDLWQDLRVVEIERDLKESGLENFERVPYEEIPPLIREKYPFVYRHKTNGLEIIGK